MAQPPAPILPARGKVAVRASPIALPPWRMISTPSWEARALVEVTMPFVASTGERQAVAGGSAGVSKTARAVAGDKIRRAGRRRSGFMRSKVLAAY